MTNQGVLTLRIVANRDGIHQAVEAFTQFTAASSVARADVWQVQVALDEWLTNIVEHAFEDRSDGAIDVCYRLADGELEVAVTDDGPAFNLLTLPPPDTLAPIEDREPGGLGIHFIRQLMDRVDHTRVDGRNTLIFAKRVVARSP